MQVKNFGIEKEFFMSSQLSQFMDQKAGESDDGAGEVSPSQRQAIFAGIMTAVKEIELRERYSSQSCEVRY